MVRNLVHREVFYCPLLGFRCGGASLVSQWNSMSNMHCHMHATHLHGVEVHQSKGE